MDDALRYRDVLWLAVADKKKSLLKLMFAHGFSQRALLAVHGVLVRRLLADLNKRHATLVQNIAHHEVDFVAMLLGVQRSDGARAACRVAPTQFYVHRRFQPLPVILGAGRGVGECQSRVNRINCGRCAWICGESARKVMHGAQQEGVLEIVESSCERFAAHIQPTADSA